MSPLNIPLTQKFELISGYLIGGFAPSSVVSSDVAVATTWNPVALFFAGVGFFAALPFPLNLVSTYSFTPAQFRLRNTILAT